MTDRVAAPPRQDVHVEMENGLKARWLVGLIEGDAFATEAGTLALRDRLDSDDHVTQIVRRDIKHVPAVPLRYDERVTFDR